MNAGNFKYKAVIFDFDYTLADSSEGICESTVYALEQMGYDIPSKESVCKTIGFTIPEMFRMFTKNDKPEDAETFRKLFKEKADEIMNLKTKVFEDVPLMLEYLNLIGIRCGIVSTKLRFRIEGFLELEGLSKYFNIIIGGDDVTSFKPNPEGLIKAIETLDMKKTECLYVGDSIVDAKTAQNAGVDFAAVLSGMTTLKQFEPYPNKGIIENMRELKIFFE